MQTTGELGYRPELDGLRAIAVALVVGFHAYVLHVPWVMRNLLGGYLGVDVFFAISGFLITLLLLQERARTDRVNLPGFYRRRALRLLPAVTAMLAAHAVVAAILGWSLGDELRTIAGALTYTTNVLQIRHVSLDKDLVHLWSLAVEEQFYFVWPPVLAFLLTRRPSWVPWVCGCGAAGSALARALATGPLHWSTSDAYVNPFFRLDGLLLGALAAWAIHAGWRPDRTLRRVMLGGGAAGLLGLVARREITDVWMMRYGFPIAAACSVAVIVGSVTGPAPRVLTARPVVALGRRSYSVYVWHPLAFVLVEESLRGRSPVALTVAAIAATLLVAELSWRYVEAPWLRLKGGPEPAPSRGRRLLPAWQGTVAAGLAGTALLVGVGAAPALAARVQASRPVAAPVATTRAAVVPPTGPSPGRAATRAGAVTASRSSTAASPLNGATAGPARHPAPVPTPKPTPIPTATPTAIPTQLTVGAPTINGTTVVLTASLRDAAGRPVGGRLLRLATASAACVATTGAEGVATCEPPVTPGAGVPTVAPTAATASFAGDATYAASSGRWPV